MAHWLLINGWGMPPTALEPLQQALQFQQQQVSILSCFLWHNAQQRQHALETALQADVIMGWSHGGQLAAHLAQTLHEQTGRAVPLICVASNPKFVTSTDWPCAMPVAQFENFQQQLAKNTASTLQRFLQLCLKGQAQQQRVAVTTLLQHVKQMQSQIGFACLQQQLQQLAVMDTRQLLQSYQGIQLHLFAQHDALIPYQVAQYVSQMPAKFLKTVLIADASHACLYLTPNSILQKMMVFLHAAD